MLVFLILHGDYYDQDHYEERFVKIHNLKVYSNYKLFKK